MDKKVMIVIIIMLALIILTFVLNEIYRTAYEKGYQLGRGELILDMNKFSYFPVIFQQGNLTQVKNTALQEICNG